MCQFWMSKGWVGVSESWLHQRTTAGSYCMTSPLPLQLSRAQAPAVLTSVVDQQSGHWTHEVILLRLAVSRGTDGQHSLQVINVPKTHWQISVGDPGVMGGREHLLCFLALVIQKLTPGRAQQSAGLDTFPSCQHRWGSLEQRVGSSLVLGPLKGIQVFSPPPTSLLASALCPCRAGTPQGKDFSTSVSVAHSYWMQA